MKLRRPFAVIIMALGIAGCSYLENNAGGHMGQNGAQAAYNPRLVSERIVKHVSYARLELAMNHADQAKEHMNEARTLIALLKSSDQNSFSDVKSGRLAAARGLSYTYYYFPVETGAIQGQKASNPLWMQPGMKLSDAEMANLEVTLGNKDNALRHLDDADSAIDKGSLRDADGDLAKLNSEIITADNEVTQPLDMARDNIALARRFVMDSNYDGARYALDHADDALNELQEDKSYHAHHRRIVALRQQIKSMRATIAKNKPGMMEKTDAAMSKWWNELKGWTHGE